MSKRPSALSSWSPEQIELGRKWVRTWQTAGDKLDRIRREELRNIDPMRAIALLSSPADYTVEPRIPKPTSGLVEQQLWFSKARRRD